MWCNGEEGRLGTTRSQLELCIPQMCQCGLNAPKPHFSHWWTRSSQNALFPPLRNGRAWLRPPFRRQPAQRSVWVGSPQLLHLWDRLSQLIQWWRAKWEHWGWGVFSSAGSFHDWSLLCCSLLAWRWIFQDYAIVVTFFCLILNGQVIMFIKSIRTFKKYWCTVIYNVI